MSKSSANFPFVWIDFGEGLGHDSQQDFEEFEANLKRGEPFAILRASASAEDHEHPQEEKQRTSLWIQKHKTEPHKLVVAMIQIEPNTAKRFGFKAFSL